MKVAVSIPDPVFVEAEALARRLNAKRSDIYARALRAFIADHAPDRVRAALDETVQAIGPEPERFGQAAARSVFDRVEW